MASAYKSALKAGADSDESMSDASQSSSDTVEESSADEADEKTVTSMENRPKSTSDSLENSGLRNRILMLTSRGVSYRHAFPTDLFAQLLI